jgi:hypothetical protein
VIFQDFFFKKDDADAMLDLGTEKTLGTKLAKSVSNFQLPAF